MEFNRKILLEAIDKIDKNSDLRNNRSSSTYDLIHNNNSYPPILILSVANQLKGGSELLLSDFDNKIEIPFKILRDNGFVISKKTKMSFYNELIKFIEVADKQEIGKGTIGVQEFNQERLKIYDDLKVETKFGTGRASAIPWISFLSEYDTVQQGIYPGYLYYKLKNVLILSYGISETNKPIRSWNLQNKKTIKEYFFDNNYGEAEKYGSSFVFKAYDIKKGLIQKQIDNDLNEIITIYKAITSIPVSTQKEKSKKMVNLKTATKQIEFDINSFQEKAIESGLIFSSQLIQRFIASLCTKPFVICSGLSGSGKTKLAQAFAQWICYKEAEGEKNEQYCIVPVGADWTNREPLLGYPNSLEGTKYVTPENGVLELMLRAKENLENEEVANKPYFLILDEMNLSHVERYFADFLSTMESGGLIPLHTIEKEKNGIPKQLNLPCNLFIIGTVNIDETTYMFSPKVLDRANTIEFRLTEKDLKEFIASDVKLDMDLLKGAGENMGESFVGMAIQKTDKNLKDVEDDLIKFFKELKKSGAEFGYRTASEMGRLMFMLKALGEKGDNLLDIAIMQKLLPKLHGSRNKLTKVLPVLGGFCLEKNADKIKEDYLDKFVNNTKTEEELKTDPNIKYPISFEKICRMYKNAIENGFASYAEA